MAQPSNRHSVMTADQFALYQDSDDLTRVELVGVSCA